MKLNPIGKSVRKAFTLIEMIGVLAVIAILASLLIPKIFEAINNARINNALVSYNTVKTAVIDHYAKFGAFDRTTNNTTITSGEAAAYDSLLLKEGFLDKPFVVKIGTNSFVRLITSAPFPPYFLGGTNNNDTASASFVVEAIIEGIAAADAKDINDRLDGEKAPFTVTLGAADTTGRVKWDGSNIVSIYVTHR